MNEQIATGTGRNACTQPPPCSTPDAAIAPTISPPGMLKRYASSAAPDEASRSTPSSIADVSIGASPPRGGGRPATPNAAKISGSATARMNSAHGLHHRDRAHVRAGVLRERHRLRERAGRGGEQRIERRPAVHEFQIGHHRSRDGDHRDGERQHAERPGHHGGDGLGRHRGAERDAEDDVDDAADLRRHDTSGGPPARRPRRRRSRRTASRPASRRAPRRARPQRRRRASRRSGGLTGVFWKMKPTFGRSHACERSMPARRPRGQMTSAALKACRRSGAGANLRRGGSRSARCAPGRRRSWRRAFP